MKPKASQFWTFMQNMSHLLNSEVFPSLLSKWNQPKNYHWLQTPGELATVYFCVNNGIINFRTWSKIFMSKLKTKPSRNLNFKSSKWNGKKHKSCQFVFCPIPLSFFSVLTKGAVTILYFIYIYKNTRWPARFCSGNTVKEIVTLE